MTATVDAGVAHGRAFVVDLPPDFLEVPLEAAREDRAAAQVAVVNALGLPERTQREGVALFLEAMARALADGPILGASFCAVRLRGTPSTATLTVATLVAPVTDALVAASAAAEALRLRGGYSDVRLERAGAHVVAVATAAQKVCVAVPVPEEPAVAFIAVTTSAARDRDTYRRVALGVAASLRRA